VPQENNEITFLTTVGGRSGEFESVSAPGLASANPDMAIDLVYNSNDIRIQFVDPSLDIVFQGDDPSVDWEDADTFTGATAPDTTNIITIENLANVAQRVEVQTDNARVHELTVASSTDPITVAVHDGYILSATNTVTVGDQGIVELGTTGVPGGLVMSAAVDVESGGLLAGNGSIFGNLNVGTDAGPQSAVLSPGFSIGQIGVTGNLVLGAKGKTQIELAGTGSGQGDTINVTGTAQLGGTLQIDATNLTGTNAGDTFEIIAAGGLSGAFANVETVGNDALYFHPLYNLAGGGVAVMQLYRGDMNGDTLINSIDHDLFVYGLMNTSISRFFAQCNCDILPQEGGDFSGNGRLDFDDIPGFQDQLPPDALREAFERYFSNVPEPSAAVLVVCACFMICVGRKRSFCR
jgi:hypothetical protein